MMFDGPMFHGQGAWPAIGLSGGWPQLGFGPHQAIQQQLGLPPQQLGFPPQQLGFPQQQLGFLPPQLGIIPQQQLGFLPTQQLPFPQQQLGFPHQGLFGSQQLPYGQMPGIFGAQYIPYAQSLYGQAPYGQGGISPFGGSLGQPLAVVPQSLLTTLVAAYGQLCAQSAGGWPAQSQLGGQIGSTVGRNFVPYQQPTHAG